MSRKDAKIENLTAAHHGSCFDPHYLGYFECFNRQDYYDAHDVLEALWLAGGRSHPDYAFYKGLIQAAGAFVHLQHQRREPNHRVHGARLPPAYRLFCLAASNVSKYPPIHYSLDTAAFCTMCRDYANRLQSTQFTRNPWQPHSPPSLHLIVS